MSFLSRKRPSPAMVVACVALAFAVAGSAVVGAQAVISKLNAGEKRQVKRIAKKQANKRITARAPGLSVANAQTVNGNRVVDIALIGDGTVAERQILNLDGLILRGSCTTGTEDLVADTTVAGGELTGHAIDGTDGPGAAGAIDGNFFDDTFNPGDNIDLVPEDSTDQVGQLAYIGGDGRFVRVFWHVEDSLTGNSCLIVGYAVAVG